jgi:predicted TIM-barrel fold metal-dependent hydrolase
VRILDAQIHEIGPWSDWTGESETQQHRILTEVMIAYLDAVGVGGAVLFPGPDDATVAWASTELPERFAFVPPISPDVPDIDAAVAAAKRRRREGLIGLRVVLGWPLEGTEMRRFEAGAWDPVFAACERHRLPVFLFITGWLPHAAEIARRYPDLTLIIDHLGLRQPPLDQPEDPPFRSLPQLLDLAKFPKVHVKLCGLPSLSREPFPYRDVEPQLRAIVDAFGADRLFWASDTSRFSGRIGIMRHQFPATLGSYPGKHNYAESLLFIRESPILSQAEKDAILGGALQRALGWPAEA